MPTRIPRIICAVAIALSAAFVTIPAASTVSSCTLPTFGPGASYRPHFEASRSTATIDNAFFPLAPGTTWIYAGLKDDKHAVDVFTATAKTRRIDHVTTRVIEDRLFLDGVLEERTSDYYAQDACGNVWYFGEDTAVLDHHGKVVDTSGSFHAGIDGAEPGVFMPAAPRLDAQFRQEWYQGEAEDVFKVVDLSAPVHVRYGSFRHALRTAETTVLERGVLDNKYYVRGIGQVSEASLTGPSERLELIDVLVG